MSVEASKVRSTQPQPSPTLSTGDPFWTVLHNSYAIAAVLTVILLARLAAQRSRPDAAPPADAARPSAPSVPATPRRG